MLDKNSFSKFSTNTAQEANGIGVQRPKEIWLKDKTLQNAIFNSVNFCSIATDTKGIIQIFSLGAERMLGYKAIEVVKKFSSAEITDAQEVIACAVALSLEFNTEVAPGFEALVYKASRGFDNILELNYIRKDGHHLPVELSVTALRDDENVIIGYLLNGTDNTAHKKINDEWLSLMVALKDKNSKLNSAIIVAEKANLAKSDFLSSMSHELRTPLNAILGFSQLIESGKPTPTPSQKRSLDQILKGGWYLLELINEILDLALIESGKLLLQLSPVSLTELIKECEAMIEPQALKRGIRVNFLPLAIPCVVLADRTRLKQIILNLLSNAVKYNKPGGSVTVECDRRVGALIRISVHDKGEGLTPEQLMQLFQPFNRLGQISSGQEGTGIGLVVCKRLTELMGGVIGVASTIGKGSVFWIDLNTTDPSKKIHPNIETKESSPAPVDAGENVHTLLYVEDNPANLMLIGQLMTRRPDICFLSATDATEGVEIARTLQPDVILMDINLPGMSGIEALKILNSDLTTAHIPVIAISANATPLNIEKGLQAGFFAYLTKPIKIHEFMETLDAALQRATIFSLNA